MPEMTINCPNCSHKFCDFELNDQVKTTEQLNVWLKAQAAAVSFWCSGCGNNYLLEDDGVDAGIGGSIQLADKSRAQIASIDVATGPAAGGTTVTVTGLAFLIDPPEVYFGGVLGVNVSVTNDTTLTVDSPAGSGVVDVSVENDNGPHPAAERLVNAFTYT